MASKRMFTKQVTDDDSFMALSSSAQALYLHLMMSSDDDGFCNQVTLSMFKAHASVSDLEALLAQRYIYQFENGVIVIKHFRMANALRKDRYTPTVFQEEMKQLRIKENGSYTMASDDGCQVVANWLPDGCHSIDKVSIEEISIDKDSIEEEKPNRKRFVPPTQEEAESYIYESGINVDLTKWFSYYEANGWKVGKNKMKDWKASLRYWASQDKPKQSSYVDRWANA